MRTIGRFRSIGQVIRSIDSITLRVWVSDPLALEGSMRQSGTIFERVTIQLLILSLRRRSTSLCVARRRSSREERAAAAETASEEDLTLGLTLWLGVGAAVAATAN